MAIAEASLFSASRLANKGEAGSAVVKVKPHGGSKRPAYFLHFQSSTVSKTSEDAWAAYLDANDLDEQPREFL